MSRERLLYRLIPDEEVKRQAVEQDENGDPYLSEEVDEEYQNDLFKKGNRYLDYKVERTGTVKALRADTGSKSKVLLNKIFEI